MQINLYMLVQLFQELGWFLMIGFLIWVMGIVFIKFIEKLVKKFISQKHSFVPNLISDYVWKAIPYFWIIISIYLSLVLSDLNDFWKDVVYRILGIMLVASSVWIFSRVLETIIFRAIVKSRDDAEAKTLAYFVAKVAEIGLGVLGLLLILQNLGIQVGALLGGLGVGGIAIAFAAQNIVSDLFGYFIIAFDQPFRVGDFIQVGLDKGTVKRIGVRSTKLNSVTGEELLIPNRDITQARVFNFRKIKERRVTFKFGVTYQTPTKILKQIPDLIKKELADLSDVEVTRVHWTDYGPSELVFTGFYLVKTNDFVKFLDVQQEINLRIKSLFETKSIEFAYPTQTIYLEK